MMFLWMLTEDVVGQCMPNDGRAVITKGDPTYICITVNGIYRSLFLPEADEFHELHLEGCKRIKKPS